MKAKAIAQELRALRAEQRRSFYDRAVVILEQLSTYAFAGKNEATIRDNWIVPLLGLLGYGQGSNLYELVSEAPLKLRTPHRKIGSSTLYVDFVPTVMKQRFWILEAKAPGKAKFEDHL